MNSVTIVTIFKVDLQISNYNSFTALSPWEDSEIRRRDTVSGKFEIVAKSDFHVNEYAPNITNIEISISTGEC